MYIRCGCYHMEMFLWLEVPLSLSTFLTLMGFTLIRIEKKKRKKISKKERKRSLALADSNVTDSFVYNTAEILRKIMLRIKADENIC